MKNWPAAILV
jgi:hypothetical protein